MIKERHKSPVLHCSVYAAPCNPYHNDYEYLGSVININKSTMVFKKDAYRYVVPWKFGDKLNEHFIFAD